MDYSKDFLPLNQQEIVALKELLNYRWKKFAKQILFSFALPFFCAGQIVSILTNFVMIANHGNPDDFNGSFLYKVLLIMWIPIFCFIGLGNVILFLKDIPPVYVDLWRKRKTVISFSAEKYSLDEFEKYYLKCPYESHLHLEVSFDTYQSIVAGDIMELHIAPQTKYLFSVVSVGNNCEISLV